jgi:hypothetical protein
MRWGFDSPRPLHKIRIGLIHSVSNLFFAFICLAISIFLHCVKKNRDLDFWRIPCFDAILVEIKILTRLHFEIHDYRGTVMFYETGKNTLAVKQYAFEYLQ